MTADFSNARWFTSSKSGSRECVEVAFVGQLVGIRDSKNRAAGYITLPTDAWHAFVSALCCGEYR
ncbi:DUF397 domain-containing protein [Nocardia sp. NPDC050697]|uniref:DUF397 domain-containing protein n=1 Tax=Nocardia sp. NPDC050697 TaxID=3155158 RepID=UPI0033FF0366